MVEDAERQVLAVVDVEYEQLLLGNFADEINVRALVMQVNIGACLLYTSMKQYS